MGRTVKKPKKAKVKSKKKGSKKSGSSSLSAPEAPPRVWRPDVDKLEEDEELQCDPSAYNSLHAFHIGWPCLSFDIVRDSLGLGRTEFPHTVFCVAGTQAEKASWNSITVFKIQNISGKERKLELKKANGDGSEMDDSESSDSDDDDDENGDGSGVPVLQLRKVFHEGTVNRIRAMRQCPHICASWGATGHVQIWDLSSHLNVLAEGDAETVHGGSHVHNDAPLARFTGHKDEGYAIDWCPLVPGKLVSGDCESSIYLWEPASNSTWNIDGNPYVGHSNSVEDLQWSPTEPDVFASCSADGSIAIWDIRLGKAPALSFQAHKADINVISWSSLATCMLASGSDDGTFSVRDLRLLESKTPMGPVVANFEYHNLPITSIEWDPSDSDRLAVSSSDNQLTIWDLSLERDEHEEAEFKSKLKGQASAPEDLPAQLVFVHQGQNDLKELHWHPYIPGMIVSTASDGFNVLMPSNLDVTLPPNDS